MIFAPVVYQAFNWEAAHDGCPPSSRFSPREEKEYQNQLRLWKVRQKRLAAARKIRDSLKAQGIRRRRSSVQRYPLNPPRPERGLLPQDIHTAKMAVLRNRTEEKWVALIGAIEDENLQLAVAKKIYWDFFTPKRWRGLDELVFEDWDCKIIRWVTRYTAPNIEDIKIALWQLGYPALLIRESYANKTAFNFTRQDEEDD